MKYKPCPALKACQIDENGKHTIPGCGVDLPEGWTRNEKFEPIFGPKHHRQVEYICPHGVGHEHGIHGCDGCCSKIDLPETPADKVIVSGDIVVPVKDL